MSKKPLKSTPARVRLLEREEDARIGNLFRLTRYRFEHLKKNADDGWSKAWSAPDWRADFFRGDAVAALLHRETAARGHELMLVRQFRFSTIIDPDTGAPDVSRDGYMLELMAGMRMKDEPWIETLRRETQEETGYEIGEYEFINSFYPSPGACSEQIHLFYARVKDADAATEERLDWGALEEQEQTLRVSKTPKQFLEMIEKREILDAKCLAAAEWMRRDANRGRFGL